jgi:hypothetical protein
LANIPENSTALQDLSSKVREYIHGRVEKETKGVGETEMNDEFEKSLILGAIISVSLWLVIVLMLGYLVK